MPRRTRAGGELEIQLHHLDQLPDLGRPRRVARVERCFGINILQVLDDGLRFRKHKFAIEDEGHLPHRRVPADCSFARWINQNLLERNALLQQRQFDLVVVVAYGKSAKFQHAPPAP
jgi:hypothetical protein